MVNYGHYAVGNSEPKNHIKTFFLQLYRFDHGLTMIPIWPWFDSGLTMVKTQLTMVIQIIAKSFEIIIDNHGLTMVIHVWTWIMDIFTQGHQ